MGGGACRSKLYLRLCFPPMVWKRLVSEPVTDDDVNSIDEHLRKNVRSLLDDERLQQLGVDESNFCEVYDLPWQVRSMDGRDVELRRDGGEQSVMFSERNQWARRVMGYKRREIEKQVDAIRRGIACVLPERLLVLKTWEE